MNHHGRHRPHLCHHRPYRQDGRHRFICLGWRLSCGEWSSVCEPRPAGVMIEEQVNEDILTRQGVGVDGDGGGGGGAVDVNMAAEMSGYGGRYN